MSLRNRRCWRGSNVRKVVSVWWSRTPHIVSRCGVKLSRATRTARQCERRLHLDLPAPRTTWRRRWCWEKTRQAGSSPLPGKTNFHEHQQWRLWDQTTRQQAAHTYVPEEERLPLRWHHARAPGKSNSKNLSGGRADTSSLARASIPFHHPW